MIKTSYHDHILSTPHVEIPERVVFGKVLERWFKRNGWPQSITESVAKPLGWQGPWASQISTAVNAKIDPKAAFFISLGQFNELIATRNFKGMTDRRTLDRIKEAEPLCHDNGIPYDGSDFFRLFTGLINAPQEYQVAALEAAYSDEGTEAYIEVLRQTFQEWAREEFLSPKEAWKKLAETKPFKAMSEEGLLGAADVIRGATTVTGEDLAAVMATQGICPGIPAMEELSGREEKGLRKALDAARIK